MERPQSNRIRWIAPVAALAVVGAAFAGPSLLAAARSDLPALTPQELLTKVAAAEPVPMSGTVVYTARLGLPEIPITQMRTAKPVNLLGGSSTVRMWTDGQGKSRAALIGSMSEYSVVHNGADAWTYSSTDNQATHYTISAADLAKYEKLGAEHKARKGAGVAADLPDPAAAVTAALAYAKTFTDVNVGSAVNVAGRDAYQLGLVPKSKDGTKGTLVDRILIAVDAKNFTPLRFQVWSVQDRKMPAVEIGYTDVSFATPDASVFAFTPPAGASVKNVTVPLPDPADMQHEELPMTGLPEGVAVHGTAWETVVEVDNVDVEKLLTGDASGAAAMLESKEKALSAHGSKATQDLMKEFESERGSGSPFDAESIYNAIATKVDGGRMISSSLLSVFITDDGRVLAGAVPTDVLVQLAK